jgi:S1-C subfamily serine protease
MGVRVFAALILVGAVAGCGGVTIGGAPAGPATVTVTPSPPSIAQTSKSPGGGPGTSGTAPTDWAAQIASVRSGVARLQVATCTSNGSGSGLLIGRNLVLTAAHVVSGATSINVWVEGNAKGTGLLSRGEVVGINRNADIALVRTARPLSGHAFSLATADPSIGDEVALIGYPFGDPGLSAKFGHVSDLGRTVTFPDDEGGTVAVSRLITTDAAVNPGNSGGPVIARDGRVVGIVSGKRTWADAQTAAEGTGWAASAAKNASMVADWKSHSPIDRVSCAGSRDRATEPFADQVEVVITSVHSQAAIAAQSLALHGTAINLGEYGVAYDLFTPAMQGRMGGVVKWSSILTTSYWRRLDVLEVSTVTRTRLQVSTILQTEQAASEGPGGQTCSRWPLDYAMVLQAGVWHIDKAQLHEAEPTAC